MARTSDDYESLVVGKQGRLVIPAHLRRELKIGEGDRLDVHRQGDALILTPSRVRVNELRGILRHKGDGHVVEHLIAERRRNAKRERDE